MAPTHPKVAARRAEVARRRARTRGRLAIAALVVFSLAGAGWLLVQSSLLDLEQVEVQGARRASVGAVRSAVALEWGDPLLLVDRGAVARRVERLPWVRDATVSFSLPATLVVRVEERTPVGWVARGSGEGSGVALVDAEGRVLDHRGVPPERLPELAVDARPPAPGKRLEGAKGALGIASSVPDGLRGRFVSVTPAKGGYVLALDTVSVVRFGPAERVAEKWDALEAVVASLGEEAVYLIDVRVPSVPAVRETEALPTTTTLPPATTTTTVGSAPPE